MNGYALEVAGKRAALLARAEQALARLDVAGEMVPSLDWFIYAFVRKEAVVSSQIEGTQATLVDLFEYEAENDDRQPLEDVRKVCNYLDALKFARGQLASPKGLPLSMRLLHEAHRRLMRGVRGANKQPGEVRRSQSWIGGTRPGNAAFVPAPPEEVPALLGDLEKYLHADDPMAPLVRIGLAHVQFETIHPYLDGNGRIGRLLITLLLEHWKLLKAPLLYLSLFFKRHRAEYYRLLGEVRKSGDWEAWTDFFLEGVATIADEAVATARDVFALVNADRQRVLAASGVGDRGPSARAAPGASCCHDPGHCEAPGDDEAHRRQGRSASGEHRGPGRDERQAPGPDVRVQEVPGSAPRGHRARGALTMLTRMRAYFRRTSNRHQR